MNANETNLNLDLFKSLFSQYCREQNLKGNCLPDECEFCSINKAYDRIFNTPESEDED